MKLSISNIAWEKEYDEQMYSFLQRKNFSGLEIAPTRIIPEAPYDYLSDIKEWAQSLQKNYGLEVSSMQSIWFGRNEQMFKSEGEFQFLLDYTKKAIDFASEAHCKNLVFGNPKSRNILSKDDPGRAIDFFRKIGDYASTKGCAIGMEANPVIYKTNYINDTSSAIQLIKEVHSEGFRLNLDVGTMIYNSETVDILENHIGCINHVHISEPFLKPIEERPLHKELALLLRKGHYDRFISIEMGKGEGIEAPQKAIEYVKEIFG